MSRDQGPMVLTFRCPKELEGLIPPPLPAARGLPGWFKTMPQTALNPILGDNIITPTEGAQATTNLTGKVTGAFTAGDTVSLSLNNKTLTTSVNAQGEYTFSAVSMADLKADADTVRTSLTNLTATEDLASGRLVRPFAASVTSLGQYALVCERIRLEKPAVLQFLDWLSDQFEQPPVNL